MSAFLSRLFWVTPIDRKTGLYKFLTTFRDRPTCKNWIGIYALKIYSNTWKH